MVDGGIIAAQDEPTEWCAPFHVVPKPSGGGAIRPVVDFNGLNAWVQRPVHPFPAASKDIRHIPSEATLFATMDMQKGYWQIPLLKHASCLTTFLMQWGRYRYLRAPMGLASSGDEFCR